MSKAKLGAVAMVAILTVIPAVALAPAASAANKAPAGAATAAATPPVVTDPLGSLLNSGAGAGVDAVAGVICGAAVAIAMLVEQMNVDPGIAQSALTFCTEFVPGDATQFIQNLGVVGASGGAILNKLLPQIGSSSLPAVPALPALPSLPLPSLPML